MLKTTFWLLAGALALPAAAAGQTCAYENLSPTLTFTTTIQRFRPLGGLNDSCLVTVTVADKQRRRLPQVVGYTATNLLSSAFSKCGAVRSYVTGYQQQAEVADNDYGDLIVADFNFDGRDDFATKNDSGGNTGPLYNYYLQTPSGRFVLSTFLTDEMRYFPERMDAQRRTLTTVVGANARYMSETTYQVDARTDAWRQVRERTLRYDR